MKDQNKVLKKLQEIFGEGRVRTNEPMSAHTTFKIGGFAQFYLEVSTLKDLIEVVKITHKLKIPLFVLGGGSNIIVADNGIKGLVVKNNCRKFEIVSVLGRVKNKEIGYDKALIYAESGVIMNQLVRFATDQGLSGLEYQLGLPGTVGGAIFMNSNFPKKQTFVGDVVHSAKLITRDGEIKDVDKSYFRFGYDKSVLQETSEIVLSVLFKLEPMDKKILWERAMQALNYRESSQPKGLSAGCTFRNISIAEALTIPTPNYVTSAGYLIDKAGLKGKRIGDAMISDLHANFILNMGNAKSEDINRLVELMKEEVYKKFGVHLLLEVNNIGSFNQNL